MAIPHPRGSASPPGDGREQVKRVLLTALAVNVLMSLLKLGVGLMSGSLAVLADAMHSATDGLSSLLGLITNGLSDPQPDRDHPYGHHKYEGVGALAIAAFIFFASFEILQTAFQRLSGGMTPLRIGGLELFLLLLALLFNVLLAAYERREGHRLGSRLLLADAMHTTSDIWTTLVVLVGLVGVVLLGLNWLDVAVAVPLALLLVRACWQVLSSNLPWLVDQIAIAPEAIHAVAMAVPGVLNCHDIASRGVLGQQVFIDMHMVVSADDLPTAHRITELVEEHLEARFGPVRCTIHLEPREYASAEITFRGVHG
ncbi:cation diffusion facilitator family transporter [Synechococcus sp. CS-1325]|uniref:cation diffusion facilitator family transporter n=1 Tax=unclassified Synechococcus TaxID=2626047 RepID=UPI000DB3D0AF|nr:MULTISPECIES: cation diffusion facilitator family transporter [unclassified Synechococcus]PZV00116.1 MAG: cation-efflux pump [Cyanobium sp.]MCT0198361.1 cation diffusion facilitator family transporter [Synechococcus sp. CS-1325]MCT0212106.1 cation diffusion facilitator family transporter [Synechococcus sp. CS-1326]MCT0229412.1 cation diffusion facilitator family transporter [Synechococcus sp. CS-1324]MCT0232894.1 cation diffusion facilitator family transporter [Synechococcus sp. CS-1327]